MIKASRRKGKASPLDRVYSLCHEYIPPPIVSAETVKLNNARASLHQAYASMIEKFDSLPFVIFLLNWIEEPGIENDTLTDVELLLLYGFIDQIPAAGIYLTTAEAKLIEHATILDAIRSEKAINIMQQEQMVVTYLAFRNWLSWETFGYFSKCEDPDLLRIKNRFLNYQLFIQFISSLKLAGQLVAKLLYFGERRSLDDVLSLDVKSIDFQANQIQYGKELISYPAHILTSITQLLGNRRRGRVFLGRQNAPLNASTIFRNFKSAGSKAGLGTSFCPSCLTANI